MERAWQDLSCDAATAFRAGWLLANASDQAVSFLGERLAAVTPIPEEKLRRWVDALAAGKFAKREAAERRLRGVLEPAAPHLFRVVQERRDLEACLRAGRLLERLEASARSAARLRQQRAVVVLERIATPAARRTLARLAEGAPGARLTVDAQTALGHLRLRDSGK